MRFALALACASTVAAQWSNNPPVYGTFPGWINGQGKAGIHVMMFEDWLCSACAADNPITNELMTTPWLDGVVGDYITMSFTVFPLPYHNYAF